MKFFTDNFFYQQDFMLTFLLPIRYDSAISKKRIRFVGNDKGFISKDSILAILPQPNYKRGVYEFLDELEIDDF